MSVSITVQFSGQIDGPNHRKVISDIKTAIEVAIAMNGVTGVNLYATEQEVTTATKSFPEGTTATSPYTQSSVMFLAGFHVNEDPVPAPATPAESHAAAVAPAPAESDTTTAAPEASAPSVESSQTGSSPADSPAKSYPEPMPIPNDDGSAVNN